MGTDVLAFGGLFAFLGRQLGKILSLAFAWATTALFGRVPANKQLYLSGMAGAALAWPIVLVGVLAASFNGFSHQEGTRSTFWAIVMVALGLGGASLLLGVEGVLIRARVRSSPAERRALGFRSLSLITTTVPLIVLGVLFLAFALHIATV